MSDKHELAIHDIPPVVFSIPYYQRGYRWTKKEVTALLNDLLTFAQSSVSNEPYCLQPLVLQKNNDDGFNVVDGQQRLTTIAIILHELGLKPAWDIKYTTEGNKTLSELLKSPGKSINDFFRGEACEAVKIWLEQENMSIAEPVHAETQKSRRNTLQTLLNGTGIHSVIFLRYEIDSGQDNGHAVFRRLNDGKTPLTSSELIRALYMESGNGLSDGEKADIAKEWDLIESEMGNEQFWAIWANDSFRDVPTRMDFLFSIVLNVDPDKARHNPLLVYSKFEKSIMEGDCLATRWEEVLRCWWWMLSCYADVESFHLIGWVSLFTDRKTSVLYREQWKDASCRMQVFKQVLRKIVIERLMEDFEKNGFDSFDSLRYKDGESSLLLRKAFVLINMLDAERRNIRFRIDLYLKDSWDIEHIASQTDNPLKEKEDREEWLRLAEDEMSDEEKKKLSQFPTFEEKWDAVWDMFETDAKVVLDKNGIGNLALLNSGTNRSYKNAIFPAKRRQILLKARRDGKENEKNNMVYIPPCTEAVFAKYYSPRAAQMRYWGEPDAVAYRNHMKELFNSFLAKANEGTK